MNKVVVGILTSLLLLGCGKSPKFSYESLFGERIGEKIKGSDAMEITLFNGTNGTWSISKPEVELLGSGNTYLV